MADKLPCWAFQIGQCKYGDKCNYPHVPDPNFKTRACTYFARGRCSNGDKCSYSHADEDISSLKANPPDLICDTDRAASEAALRQWRYFIPRDPKNATKLGVRMSKFCQGASELTAGDTDIMQQTITMLAEEGGMVCIAELLDQPFEALTATQLDRIFRLQLLPFFQAVSNPSVKASAILENRLVKIGSYIYGPGGDRAVQVFQAVARHLTTLKLVITDYGDVDEALVPAFEHSLGALVLVVQSNTSAQAHEGLVPIVSDISALLEATILDPPSSLRNTKKHLQTLTTRFGLGAPPPNTNGKKAETAVRATFELEKEKPGALSPNGPRHNNDHDDIRKIAILPTLEEILCTRSEYLPSSDPRAWHLEGLPGLLDRNFRLLREDTVGQLRDAAKSELERLQNPFADDDGQLKRQGVRTYVYNNLHIADVAFDAHDGLELALGFDQPAHLLGQSQTFRREWWEGSRRLKTEALICLLSSEGSATFLIVAPEPTGAQTMDRELSAARGRLHRSFNLYSDPARAHLIARLIKYEDIRSVMDVVLGNDTANFALCEFPDVILPSFKHTLEALQSLTTSLDVPFKDILAPLATENDAEQIADLPLPAHATQPGFKFDLSCLTQDDTSLHLTPGQPLEDTISQPRSHTSLDARQAEALVSCLTRSLGLVQGPPGTGKSFTGVEIIRALLANKASVEDAPILCVTFTNHALDAGLLRLVDLGVKQIIRIGSRSKSDRLADVNLRVVAQREEMTRTERQDRGKLKRNAEEEAIEINRILGSLGNMRTETELKKYLDMYYKEHHDELFLAAELGDDGFIPANHQSGNVVQRWLKGGDDPTTDPRSFDDLQEVSIHDMSSAERRRLRTAWFAELKGQMLDQLTTALESYNDIKAKLDGIKRETDLRVLKQANIIGMTTSELARNLDLLRRVKVKVVVIEEAGEVLEADALTALLPSVDHAILTGDHQQLRPPVHRYELSAESKRGEQDGLNISLFERLVDPTNLMAQPLSFNTLEIQRRIHPIISELIRATMYPHLVDAESVKRYPEVVGKKKRMFSLPHEHPEDEGRDAQSTSHTNDFEVDMVAALASHLVREGIYSAGGIAVITPYLGQLRKLRNKLSSSFEILLNDKEMDALAAEGEEEVEVNDLNVNGQSGAVEVFSDSESDACIDDEDASDSPADEQWSRSRDHYRKHLPHLRPLPRPTPPEILADLTLNQPSSFKRIRIRRAVTEKDYPGGESQLTIHRKVLETRSDQTLDVRYTQIKTLAKDEGFPASKSVYKRFQMLDQPGNSTHDLTRLMIAGMKATTAGVLGRPGFDFHRDVQDMARFTVVDLENLIVYVGYVLKEDGSVETYTGSSVNRDGSGKRVVMFYERTMRCAHAGYYPRLNLRELGHFMVSAMASDTVRVEMRPLFTYVLPKNASEGEIKKGRSIAKFFEGHFADLLGTMKQGQTGKITMSHAGTVAMGPILQHYNQARSDYAVSYTGLNHMHPYVQGYPARPLLVEKVVVDGKFCPLCDEDMTETRIYDKGRAPRSNSAQNPCKDMWPWLPHNFVCLKCKRWLNLPGTRTRLSALSSLDEARKLRAKGQSTGHGSKRKRS